MQVWKSLPDLKFITFKRNSQSLMRLGCFSCPMTLNFRLPHKKNRENLAYSCQWPLESMDICDSCVHPLLTVTVLGVKKKKRKKEKSKRALENALWIGWGWWVQVHLMGDQLYWSAALTLMMLSATGWGRRVPCLTRGQKQSQEKALMKDKPFVPTTDFWKLYFTAAILPNCFCALGWLFK